MNYAAKIVLSILEKGFLIFVPLVVFNYFVPNYWQCRRRLRRVRDPKTFLKSLLEDTSLGFGAFMWIILFINKKK